MTIYVRALQRGFKRNLCPPPPDSFSSKESPLNMAQRAYAYEFVNILQNKLLDSRLDRVKLKASSNTEPSYIVGWVMRFFPGGTNPQATGSVHQATPSRAPQWEDKPHHTVQRKTTWRDYMRLKISFQTVPTAFRGGHTGMAEETKSYTQNRPNEMKCATVHFLLRTTYIGEQCNARNPPASGIYRPYTAIASLRVTPNEQNWTSIRPRCSRRDPIPCVNCEKKIVRNSNCTYWCKRIGTHHAFKHRLHRTT